MRELQPKRIVFLLGLIQKVYGPHQEACNSNIIAEMKVLIMLQALVLKSTPCPRPWLMKIVTLEP